jgi:hypothetical protein
VDDDLYSIAKLRTVIELGKTNAEPIRLVVASGDPTRLVNVDYHEGERYPHLECDTSKTTYLVTSSSRKAERRRLTTSNDSLVVEM